jgi:class 3 adenylate cyclase
VDRPCPSCGSHNEPAARFCSTCGTALPSLCPRCGSELPAGGTFCPSCGHRIAGATPEGERKLVTALFADLVDSTALAEGRDPERTRAVLGAYFSAMSAVIESWGGTIEKYIGDAIVALFGVPVRREDDAARALHAALDMIGRLEDLNATLDSAHGVRVRMRIGINTGEVMAASDSTSDQAIVAGDAMNVAARLEGAATTDGILTGDRTHQLAGPGFSWGERSLLTVKGRTDAVGAWPLVGATERAVQPRPSFSSPLVAREPELAILGRLLDEVVQTRQPRLALIVENGPRVSRPRLGRAPRSPGPRGSLPGGRPGDHVLAAQRGRAQGGRDQSRRPGLGGRDEAAAACRGCRPR